MACNNLDSTTNRLNAYTYPIAAAKKFISRFEQVRKVTDEQRALLAAAYYTLATEQNNISSNRSKMHVNSAITLLRKIPITERKKNWHSQIAHAYFKRAELLEDKKTFLTAALDYQRTMEALAYSEEKISIDDDDHLLRAQAAISIADLIVNKYIDRQKMEFSHPLYYINTALEHLAEIQKLDDNVFATQAYAHQIAGIALSQNYFEEAKEAFRVGLFMAFKSEDSKICPMIADIYTCLGLLYEQQYQLCPIQKESSYLLDHAMIYFGLSLMFSPSDANEKEDDLLALESLFEIIYRVLDPHLPLLSDRVACDLIDALIYGYMCIIDKVLPDRTLEYQLSQPNTLDLYAQHIHWLVMAAYRRTTPTARLLGITKPVKLNLATEAKNFLQAMENGSSGKVYYLNGKTT